MDDRRPADDRVEHAEFAPARIDGRGGRSWGPLLIAGWLVVLAAVVGAGTLGRTLDRSAEGAQPSPPLAGAATPLASALAGGAPEALAPSGPIRSGDPDPLAYDVSSDAAGLTITGTILARPAVWVFVSIQTVDGDVVTWRSLSVEDPNGGIRPDRTPSFELYVPLAATLATGPLVVEVNAYNNIGRKIGSVRRLFGDPAAHKPILINTGMVR